MAEIEKAPLSESDQKLFNLVKAIAGSPAKLQVLREALLESGFGLRGQVETTPFPGSNDPERMKNARTAIVLDAETEGLDPIEHRVIQLSMQKVLYDEHGIVAAGDFYDRYSDPGRPLDLVITELTGITDEMVAGQKISESEIRDFIGDADRVIAHNAAFDRKFVERSFPAGGFDTLTWDCSIEQVDWAARGERSRSLEVLMLHQGMVYKSHNSASDIRALAWILNTKDAQGKSAFSEMLESSDVKKLHIFADGASYDTKEILKENGYRWAPRDEPVLGKGNVWHKEFTGTQDAIEAEKALLRKVFRRDVSLTCFEQGPRERYSVRNVTTQFMTKEPESLVECLGLSERLPEHSQPTFGF